MLDLRAHWDGWLLRSYSYLQKQFDYTTHFSISLLLVAMSYIYEPKRNTAACLPNMRQCL